LFHCRRIGSMHAASAEDNEVKPGSERVKPCVNYWRARICDNGILNSSIL
jgi:hypothetical protein